MEEIMLYTIENVNNVKELHIFFDGLISTVEAESMVNRGYTLGNLKAYYGDIPADWMWRMLNED